MAETPEAPETTPASEWLVPNQDKFEQVIDARLAKHAENEASEKKSSASRASRSTPAPKEDPKDQSKEDAKS